MYNVLIADDHAMIRAGIPCRLAEGRSVSQIGAQMFISAKTVSAYRARILAKMQMTTNADLTSYALRAGLILA